MVEFITEKIPQAGRVIVDKNLLRLYPPADGMMRDECMVGMGEPHFVGRKRSATCQKLRNFTRRSIKGLR